MWWLLVILVTKSSDHVRYCAICDGFVAIRPRIMHFIENDKTKLHEARMLHVV